MSQQCSAKNRNGKRCGAWAVAQGSNALCVWIRNGRQGWARNPGGETNRSLHEMLLICGAPSPGNVFHRFDEIRRKFQLDPFASRATIAQPLARHRQAKSRRPEDHLFGTQDVY